MQTIQLVCGKIVTGRVVQENPAFPILAYKSHDGKDASAFISRDKIAHRHAN